MILKDKTQTSSASIKLDAGIKQEHDVAFYLRRAYKNSDQVMVLNDLRIEHDGEIAQIDHLIVYTYGFIVVESKSIRGEVQVNGERIPAWDCLQRKLAPRESAAARPALPEAERVMRKPGNQLLHRRVPEVALFGRHQGRHRAT